MTGNVLLRYRKECKEALALPRLRYFQILIKKKKKVSKKEKANANSISAPQFSVSGKIRREQGYSERVWRKARIQYPCT